MTADFLRVVSGPSRGRQIDLAGRIVIGRSATSALEIDDPAASRTHATVDVSADGRVTVADAGSSRGTRLDGIPVTDPVDFPVGGTLAVGRSTVRRLRAVRAEADAAVVVLRSPEGVESRHRIEGSVSVGRDAAAGIHVADASVSRAHVVLERVDDGVVVSDAGSTAGATVNGRRLTGRVALRTGDDVELGESGWSLRVDAPSRRAVPTEFRVRREGEEEEAAAALQIDAGAPVAIGAVAAAVAAHTGAGLAAWTFYRDRDGGVFDPRGSWGSAALQRGELLVLADVPVADTEDDPEAGADSFVVRPGAAPAATPEPVSIALPRPPETSSLRGRGLGWQLAGGAAGVIGGLVIAIALQNWLFAVIGGVTGLGAVLFGILGDQSRRRHGVRRYREKLDAVQERAVDAVGVRRSALLQVAPDIGSRRAEIAAGSEGLWSRPADSADFLRLRLGLGERRSFVTVDAGREEIPAEFADQVARLTAERTISGVPVQTPSGGVFGLVGPSRVTYEMARSLVVDAVAHHAPSTLAIHIVGRADDWADTIWLPHVADALMCRLAVADASVAELPARVRADLDAGRRILVVAPAEAVAGWGDLVRSWRAADGLILLTAGAVQDIPREASSWAVVESSGAVIEGVMADGPIGPFEPDRLPHDDAVATSLLAARLVDPSLPVRSSARTSTLLELSGARTDGVIDVARLWRRTDPAAEVLLTAALGTAADGSRVEVELRGGPHTMIAGTTGSGKSELLASLLASLIARNSPHELALFLIDFKGGATFARFAPAPHVVGIVTDLESDAGLARRAFSSLEVELGRRKALLGAAGAANLDAYRARGLGDSLPVLLVVVDEFALLAQTHPEVKATLDTVASQGRSLGVHLVLATQSPSGITDAIRANTSLWMSLRVVSAAESNAVLGAPDAAHIPVQARGRAVIRLGSGPLRTFQTARVTIPAPPEGSTTVQVHPFGDPGSLGPETTSVAAEGLDDLDLLVAAVREEAELGRVARPRSLWLPPLSASVSADDLPDADDGGILVARIGLADLVAKQQQPAHAVDLAVTGLLVTGAPRSGRSTALLQVAADLAESHPPGDVHFYGIHAYRALDPLLSLPHTGAVVSTDDTERLERLLDRLATRVAAGGGGLPRVVLFVDDYPAVRESMDSRPPGRLHDRLLALITNGRPAGVHVALATSQPTDVRLAAMAGLGHRLMLRVVDRVDYQAIDWRPTGDAATVPAGRAVVAGGVQVQVVDADLPRAAHIAAGWPTEGAPTPIRALPDRVAASDLPQAPEGADALGLGGRDVATVAVETAAGAHLVVLGESGTGRSTALLMLAHGHLAHPDHRVVAFAPRGGPLASLDGLPGARVWGADGADALLAEAEDATNLLVLIDDSERWPASAGDRLERVLRQARDAGGRAVVAARAGDWARAYDGWARYMASLKRALVLSNFGELGGSLDVRLESPSGVVPPGRGYLVRRGVAELVQVAVP